MLEGEKVIPAKLAYDRPSPKLLAFLKKHFGLVDYVPQNNNYVVYNQYFSGPPKFPSKSSEKINPPILKEEAKTTSHEENDGPAIITQEFYEKLKLVGKENKEDSQKEEKKQELLLKKPIQYKLNPPWATEKQEENEHHKTYKMTHKYIK